MLTSIILIAVAWFIVWLFIKAFTQSNETSDKEKYELAGGVDYSKKHSLLITSYQGRINFIEIAD